MPAMLVLRTSWLRRWRGTGGPPPKWRHRRTAVRTRPPASRARTVYRAPVGHSTEFRDDRGLAVTRETSAVLQGPSYRWPGDENNQDVSSLVGKVDIRKLEF